MPSYYDISAGTTAAGNGQYQYNDLFSTTNAIPFSAGELSFSYPLSEITRPRSYFCPDSLEGVRSLGNGDVIIEFSSGPYLQLSDSLVRQMLEKLGDGFSGETIREGLEDMFGENSDGKGGAGE